MKSYHRQGECEFCQDEEAEIYADGYWLCLSCEEEMEEDKPLLTALELARIYWGYAEIAK